MVGGEALVDCWVDKWEDGSLLSWHGNDWLMPYLKQPHATAEKISIPALLCSKE